MNKYQEVINEIIETSGEFLTRQEKKSIEILQELVGKAIPKKVVKLKKSQYGYTHQCPSCERLVGTIVYNVNVRTISEIEHDNYCCSCGQALDWSD